LPEEGKIFAEKAVAGRLLGLETGDWSTLLIGVALLGLLLVLF
jgi:hypothetical protein